MKPLGLSMQLKAGVVSMAVTPISRAEDAVWSAVEEAILSGWNIEHFKRESAIAWVSILERQAKDAQKEWSKNGQK